MKIDHQRLAEAFAYAADIHASQVRKSTDIAYISHLMSVSALVIEHGGDTDQAIAGLLHDALEDCGMEHLPIIQQRFGQRAAAIVVACTDGTPDEQGKKAPWRERKEQYLAHLRHASPDVLLVSACDKLHNARSVLSDLKDIGAEVFTRFTGGQDGTLWYYGQLATIFGERTPGRLASELLQTVDAMLALSESHTAP